MSKKKKQMKRTADNRKFIFWAVGIVALIAIVFTVKGIYGSRPGGSPGGSPQTPAVAQLEGNVQVLYMKVSAAGYSPNYLAVKQGVPVKIITDSTQDAGCVRGFVAPDLGINQALNVGKDEINFTPTKSGQIAFTCQMRMSTGTIEVS